MKIQQFKAQGLNDDKITVELQKLGMGWYPKTGATWRGTTLTPEEQAKMPIPVPSSENSIPKQQNSIISLITLSIEVAYMRTSSSSYAGVNAEIVCGSMDVASGQTQKYYICVQL